MNEHELFMKKALAYAARAASIGEVPVGALIVKGTEIVSWGYNRRESKKNALCHAEIEAIYKACRKLGGWRLWQCDMYVTLEPCTMCAGAIINSRLRNVYIGSRDEKAGAFGGRFDLNSKGLNHKPNIEFGILEDESKILLQSFFKELREKNKNKKANG